MNTKNLVGGLMAGAALGVAIGMLLAPDSGVKTRERLARGARKFSDSLKNTALDSIHVLKENVTSVFNEAAIQAKNARNQANV